VGPVGIGSAALATLIGVGEISAAAFALWRTRRGYARTVRPRFDAQWLPRCAIVIPTKGVPRNFAGNAQAHLALDYPDYEVIFVVESEDDAGVPLLRELVHGSRGRAQLVIAGLATRCSQQNHNMVAGVAAAAARAPDVLAFCDNDVAPARDWLRALVLPLSNPDVAVATGYRWLVAPRGTLGAQIHVFVNMTMHAHFAALTHFFGSGLWGGSFALRRTEFEARGVAARWSETISDDLSLTEILRAHRRRSVLTADVLIVTDDVLDSPRAAIAWYARQLLNLKAYERFTWAFAVGGPLLAAGGLILALPWALLAAARGGSFWAHGGLAATIFLGAEIITALLYACTAPTRSRWLMVARVPLLRLAQVAAYLATIGRSSLVWSGTRYRFDRRGKVIGLERGVAAADYSEPGHPQPLTTA